MNRTFKAIAVAFSLAASACTSATPNSPGDLIWDGYHVNADLTGDQYLEPGATLPAVDNRDVVVIPITGSDIDNPDSYGRMAVAALDANLSPTEADTIARMVTQPGDFKDMVATAQTENDSVRPANIYLVNQFLSEIVHGDGVEVVQRSRDIFSDLYPQQPPLSEARGAPYDVCFLAYASEEKLDDFARLIQSKISEEGFPPPLSMPRIKHIILRHEYFHCHDAIMLSHTHTNILKDFSNASMARDILALSYEMRADIYALQDATPEERQAWADFRLMYSPVDLTHATGNAILHYYGMDHRGGATPQENHWAALSLSLQLSSASWDKLPIDKRPSIIGFQYNLSGLCS